MCIHYIKNETDNNSLYYISCYLYIVDSPSLYCEQYSSYAYVTFQANLVWEVEVNLAALEINNKFVTYRFAIDSQIITWQAILNVVSMPSIFACIVSLSSSYLRD